MPSRRNEHWRETQLTYDGSVGRYSEYTHAVIRNGHAIVVQRCEQIARDLGHQLAILDVGCGWTDFYPRLSHVIGTYVGVEPAMVQLTRAEPRSNQYLMLGVGERLCLCDSCMDIVLHVADLDHCFDVGKAIQETFRVLKPGGRTIILLENRGRLSNDIRRLFNREISHGVEHLYYFTVEDIQTLVEPYGTIEFLRSYGFLLGFDLLSRFLSREVIEVLATLSDRVLGKLFATKGQHFVVCASKKEDGAAATIRFLCPQCGTGFAWGDKTCKSCLREIRWIREDMVDMLAEELK